MFLSDSSNVYNTLFTMEAVGNGRYKITSFGFATQEGFIVLILGGEKPHVGAVAVAIPRPSLKNSSKISSTSSVFTITGHKDDYIARPAAEKLARRLGEVVVAVAGVHVDNASKEDIKILMRNSIEAVKRLEEKLGKLKSYLATSYHSDT